MNRKIRVMVVDDSALVRSLLAEIINRQHDMECIGTANDPLVAREMIREKNPDVITLDIEMPKMDGIDFLGRIMRLRPMPVLMISTLTERGAEVTMRALELGAVDFVSKPRVGVANGLTQLSNEIVEKIRIAATAHVHRMVKPAAAAAAPAGTDAAGAPAAAKPPVSSATLLGRVSTEKLIAIGASTGGTEAIKEVLTQMPADAPAIVITQHMPASFTASFAARLDRASAATVAEATDGAPLAPGHIYIAPGGSHHLEVHNGRCRLTASDLVNGHRPSVDVLFHSVARQMRPMTGVILTGMGRDGAQGLLAMRQAGARTLIQDEATAVVWGMPGAAHKLGAAEEIVPLERIAERLLTLARANA